MKILKYRIGQLLVMVVLVAVLTQCKEDDVEFNYELPPAYTPKDSTEFNNARFSTNIIVHATDGVEISPYLLGVNNDWSVVSSDIYYDFNTALNQIGAQNVRFPGGWESEFYEWTINDTPEWNKRPSVQGASIQQVLELNPKSLSIVVPTLKAMNAVPDTEAWNEAIAYCKNIAEEAIDLTTPSKILTIEIGNEWWLQYAGGKTRTQKLENYAHVAKEIATFIREKYPNSDFKILVNGDYTYPEEFSTIKNIFGESIGLIDGCALHPYAGYNPVNSPKHDMRNMGANILACKANLGRDYIHLSEWAPSKDYNNHKIYAQGANLLMEQVYEFGRTGANAGAFWPPSNTSIVGLGLFNSSFSTIYPTGQMFAELTSNFKGKALKVTDGLVGSSGETMRAIASKDGNTLVVYVVGHNNRWTRVDLDIEGVDVKSVEIHDLFMPATSEVTDPLPMIKVENVDYAITDNTLTFYINENRPYCIYKFKLELN